MKCLKGDHQSRVASFLFHRCFPVRDKGRSCEPYVMKNERVWIDVLNNDTVVVDAY